MKTNKERIAPLMKMGIPSRFIAAKLKLPINTVMCLKWEIKNPDKVRELRRRYRNKARKLHPERRKKYERNYLKKRKKKALEARIERLNQKLKELQCLDVC